MLLALQLDKQKFMIFNVLHFAAFENHGQDVGKTWCRRTTQ